MNVRPATVALVIFFAFAMAVFSIFAPRFASASNMEDLMSGFAFIAILAMGEAFPILTRGIDLSVGAIVALVGMAVFDLALIFHVPGYLILPIALGVGTLAGAFNGTLIVFLRLQPFIATLATLATYRGIVYAISGRQLVEGLTTTPITDKWITGLETYFDIGRMMGINKLFKTPSVPLSFFIMLGVFAVLQSVLLLTKFGRSVLTVGGNAEAARLAGINTGWVTIASYAISGCCAGLAGLLLVAKLTTSTEGLGFGMELSAIAAAVIGGVSLAGGVGSMFGPALGAFLLGSILLGLTLMQISEYLQQVITGMILLAAVGYDKLLFVRRQRRLTADAG
jgi:ribose/xylose/arabinose/galactoside ABC-type transport system permease subunit